MKIQRYLPASWPASQTTQAPSLGVHFLQGSGPLFCLGFSLQKSQLFAANAQP